MTTIEQPVANFTIQKKVSIGLDALDSETKREVSRILKSREAFLAHVSEPPGSHQLVPGSRFWEFQGPGDLRILYTNDQGNITIMALMLRQVLEEFGPSQRSTVDLPHVPDSQGIPG